jgi:hypothetical protein
MRRVGLYLSTTGELMLETPSSRREGLTHAVKIPPDENGMKVIMRVLTALSRSGEGTIGLDSAPTQSMVKDWLSKNQPQREGEQRASMNIEEMGL